MGWRAILTPASSGQKTYPQNPHNYQKSRRAVCRRSQAGTSRISGNIGNIGGERPGTVRLGPMEAPGTAWRVRRSGSRLCWIALLEVVAREARWRGDVALTFEEQAAAGFDLRPETALRALAAHLAAFPEQQFPATLRLAARLEVDLKKATLSATLEDVEQALTELMMPLPPADQ